MKLSGSRYHLAVNCSWAFRPDVRVEDRPAGQAARIGTAVHGMVDAHVRGAPEPAYEEALEAAPIARQAIKWLGTQPRLLATEIAIAYDPTTDTARELTVTGHREYGELLPTEIPTTLDMLWLSDDDHTVIVRDLKTGAKQHAHPEQLYIQALAATRVLGKSRAQVGFVFARKTKCDADPLEELGPGELEAESWRAASIVRRLPVAKPEPGNHCYWCPARPACPAHNNREQEMTT